LEKKDKYEKYRPKKFLGQNFLCDDNIAKKIIKYLDVKKEDVIIEIGAGYGALTKHLVKTEKTRYIAVDIDKKIIDILSEKYNQYTEKDIILICKDFLDFDLRKDISGFSISHKNPIKIVGNIPYNITSEILFKLFSWKDVTEKAVLMMQKEVSMRLTAKPNTKSYGILSVQTQINCIPGILFNVPPEAFFPKPKVNSSVIELDFRRNKFSEKTQKIPDYNILTKIIRESFAKRRKTMRNSLKDFLNEYGINTSEIDFDFSRRPESVSVDEFIKLAKDIIPRQKS